MKIPREDRAKVGELVRQRREEERRTRFGTQPTEEERRAAAEAATREQERRREEQLAAITRATRRKAEVDREWRAAIRAGTELSLRETANLAEVSHTTVNRLRQSHEA
jgi:hypothetical protein